MQMHYCTCQINLAGQGFHVIQILPTEPMSWPEVQVMMVMHGEENVFDIKPVAIADTNVVAEKRRLAAKFRGSPIVEQVFPGRSPTMELLVPGELADQPSADEYGVPKPADDDDDEVLGRDPPAGPAIMKPGPIRRPFPPASTEN